VNIVSRKSISSFELLNKEQQSLIEEYIKFRRMGGKVIFENFRSKKWVANENKTLMLIKKSISTLFVIIICGRTGMEVCYKKDFSLLSKSEQELFNPEGFDPLSINKYDYFFLSAGRKTETLIGYFNKIRWFFYWLLSKIDEEESLSPQDYYTVRKRILSFLQQFPRTLKDRPTNEIIVKQEKAYLTREQLILVKQLFLESIKGKTQLRDATAWQLMGTSGVRPEEMLSLRIEYFLLDENGYLKLNELGFGELALPTHASKGGYSPSHPIYRTLIPSETVTQLNKYLSNLYRSAGINNPKGIGFLFRPDPLNPDIPFKKNFFHNAIKKIRPKLHFLTEEQKKDFNSKTARRSMNNLINGYSVRLVDERLNGRIQEVAANYQMRHKPKGETVWEKHYTDLISKEEFYSVINQTINFPWNYDQLKEWEEIHCYRKSVYKLDEVQTSEINPLMNNSQVLQKLKILESELNNLVSVPKEMNVKQWMSKRTLLKKEIEKLKSIL
jgi:integrase